MLVINRIEMASYLRRDCSRILTPIAFKILGSTMNDPFRRANLKFRRVEE
jgi:hypothetical protein